MTVHLLKTAPAHFCAVASGEKKAEWRRDDRSPRFQVGHRIVLASWARGSWRGPAILCRVSHISRGRSGHPNEIPAGFAVLSLEIVECFERGAAGSWGIVAEREGWTR